MSAISDVLALGAPAVTGLIDRMEKLELVTRHKDTKDRRGAVCDLTEKGRQTAEKADVILRDLNADLERKLGDDEAEQVYDSLTILATEDLN